jgi:hypothetical protein
VLKTVRDSCEGALKAFAKERTKHDPQNFVDAGDYLKEIDEFIGGDKLQLMITIVDGAAKKQS